VAKSILDGVELGAKREVGVIAILLSSVIFSSACWLFSMPSSESHAIMASLCGASIALSKTASLTPAFEILLYMILSCLTSFCLSCVVYLMLKGAHLPWKRLQIASCALSSAMHGAQDGQKLLALLIFLYPTQGLQSLAFPTLAVGVVLFLGTLLGGGRIVKTMGEGIVALKEKSAFVSEVSSSACLIFCSALGLPVSTSNIKACSVAGAGLGEKSDINCKLLWRIAIVSLVTIPVCMLISLAIVRILL
jgi:PiT family inorganic phosphate transporter